MPRHTTIFHPDRPGEAADLVVTLDGSANGIGGSLMRGLAIGAYP